MLRKLGGAFFLVVILFNLFGFYISFYIDRNEIKNARANEMNSVDIRNQQKLMMSVRDYQNAVSSDNNEVVINGTYYDVNKVCITGDSAVVYVAMDNEETDVVKGFISMLFDRSHESQRTGNNMVLKFFQIEFYKPEPFSIAPVPSSVITSTPTVTFFTAQASLSTLSPPPDSLKA